MSGTSQAAAQVSAGAAVALVKGAPDVKAAVLNCADKLSHLQNKVVNGRSLNITNILADAVVEEMQSVSCEDDFDVHGYQPTPQEAWELFSATETVEVAAGYDASYALKADGSVWAWGDNYDYALGIGRDIMPGGPTQVPGVTNIVSIQAGRYSCYALKRDGTVLRWGAGINEVPLPIPNIENVSKIWMADNLYYQKRTVHSIKVMFIQIKYT